MLPENVTVPQVISMAYRSRQTLRAQLKSVAREYSDRIRQLDHLMERASASDEAGADALTGVDKLSLSPELKRLLVNPTHGL